MDGCKPVQDFSLDEVDQVLYAFSRVLLDIEQHHLGFVPESILPDLARYIQDPRSGNPAGDSPIRGAKLIVARMDQSLLTARENRDRP